MTVSPDAFEVRYNGDRGQVATLSVSVPNPGPPDANSTQRMMEFRGDHAAAYQQQDRSNPGSLQWIIWNEPGRWAGQPSVENSARTDTVPYFFVTTGVAPDQFWSLANSFAAVPVSSAPPAVPTVTVTPATGLVDGQQVDIALSGFQPSERVRLSECWSPDSASNLGCGPQAAQQPFVDTDASGAGTTTFVVHSTASLKPYNTTLTEPCAGQCAIVAARGVDGQPPGVAVVQFR